MITNNKSKRAATSKVRQNKSSGMSRVHNAPVAKAKVIKQTSPQYKSLPNGDVIVHHRELFGDVTTTSTGEWQVIKYPVQPGLTACFPWLARLSSNYEMFKFEKLSFEYESTCSTNTPGVVVLAMDTDPYDKAPSSKVQAMSYERATRANLWDNCRTVIPVEMRNKVNYVRFGSIPNGSDLKSYDLGNLWVGTQGSNTQGSKGELYVSYSVRLKVPQMDYIAREYQVKTTNVSPGFYYPVPDSGFSNPVLLDYETGNISVTWDDFDEFNINLPGEYILITSASISFASQPQNEATEPNPYQFYIQFTDPLGTPFESEVSFNTSYLTNGEPMFAHDNSAQPNFWQANLKIYRLKCFAPLHGKVIMAATPSTLSNPNTTFEMSLFPATYDLNPTTSSGTQSYAALMGGSLLRKTNH